MKALIFYKDFTKYKRQLYLEELLDLEILAQNDRASAEDELIYLTLENTWEAMVTVEIKGEPKVLRSLAETLNFVTHDDIVANGINEFWNANPDGVIEVINTKL